MAILPRLHNTYANGEFTIIQITVRDNNVEQALRAMGGEVIVNRENFQSRVVRDRELITGQNPASASEFTKELLASLRARAAMR